MAPRHEISLAAALFLLLALAALVLWRLAPASALDLHASVETTAASIRSWGAWGVAGSIGLMVAHSFMPFPAEIIACANGMIYGPVWGSVVTWLGAMLGASAAFAVVRLVGRPFLHRILPTRERQRLAEWSAAHGGSALLVSRLIPVIAFNLINYAAALTEISWWTFLWATGAGILPLTILLAVLGDRMLAIPLWAWLLLGAAAALGWLLWLVAARR